MVLGHSIRTAGVEGGRFPLGHLLHHIINASVAKKGLRLPNVGKILADDITAGQSHCRLTRRCLGIGADGCRHNLSLIQYLYKLLLRDLVSLHPMGETHDSGQHDQHQKNE